MIYLVASPRPAPLGVSRRGVAGGGARSRANPEYNWAPTAIPTATRAVPHPSLSRRQACVKGVGELEEGATSKEKE